MVRLFRYLFIILIILKYIFIAEKKKIESLCDIQQISFVFSPLSFVKRPCLDYLLYYCLTSLTCYGRVSLFASRPLVSI